MELLNQHSKAIMEGCKERAREAGLCFQDESLEYIVTNRDLLELSPKVMIPTLYDYWVHDVEVLREKGKYELYPSNPYETVINTRPAISFYNDNNPDWLNVMIFYHVLGHIDFFQNNVFFRHTWEYDFTGQALSDKRVIARLRSEKGRWVDYVIEFCRSIDNLVGYFEALSATDPLVNNRSSRLDFYFDLFLQKHKKTSTHEYIKEIERYNQCCKENESQGEDDFFSEINRNAPEFEALFRKHLETRTPAPIDLMEHLMTHSKVLKREDNRWMRTVMQIIRNTSLFFQPQIRTKIMNEGWASYWHETLFLQDDRISGHEIDYARVNAYVTSLPRVGTNPYALGMRLFAEIEQRADKGRHSIAFQRMQDSRLRKEFDTSTGSGKDFIFKIRRNYCDFMFVNEFLDQDFVNQHRLFVAGKRLDKQRMTWQYYVKSRKAEDYRKMITDGLYHPPRISIQHPSEDNGELFLEHRFEGKPLIKEYIANTLLGIEYLWGQPVHLDTHEPQATRGKDPMRLDPATMMLQEDKAPAGEIRWQKVRYTMKDRKLSRQLL